MGKIDLKEIHDCLCQMTPYGICELNKEIGELNNMVGRELERRIKAIGHYD